MDGEKGAVSGDKRGKREMNILQSLRLRDHERREMSSKIHGCFTEPSTVSTFSPHRHKVLRFIVFFFVDVFQRQPEPRAFIVQMHRAAPRSVFCELWRTDKRTRLNITCSHQRWFQEKRGPDVYEVRPSRGSRGGVGTGPFPSSHSPVGCPCEREEGRMLGQGYLWE